MPPPQNNNNKTKTKTQQEPGTRKNIAKEAEYHYWHISIIIYKLYQNV